MTLLRARYTKIERLVEDLLKGGSNEKPPVNVEKIAESQGAEIFRDDFDADVSGVLVRDGKRKIIGVQRNHSQVRQRFTVAHELGHTLLHDISDIHVDRAFTMNWRRDRSEDDVDANTEIQEIEANAFAASLLMPRNWVKAYHGEKPFDIEDEEVVTRLAQIFNVSRQAMSFRLLNVFSVPRYDG